MSNKTAIITGISGQDGAYLAKDLLEQGINVLGIVRDKNSILSGIEYLKIRNYLEIKELKLEDPESIYQLVKAKQLDFLFNLAAQSSVAESFKNPHSTIIFNVHSTLNLLESIRNFSSHTRFYQATSSEMYGSVQSLPICENTLLNPQSPYAISKSACHHLVRNYRASYHILASSVILFNRESVLRNENFFIMKVIKTSLDILEGRQDHLIVGNIDIRRDFGYAPQYVKAMIKMVQMDEADDFIICSGQSISLREVILHIFHYLGIDEDRIIIDSSLFRPSEIEDIYGDNSKAKQMLDWEYKIDFKNAIELILEEYKNNFYYA